MFGVDALDVFARSRVPSGNARRDREEVVFRRTSLCCFLARGCLEFQIVERQRLGVHPDGIDWLRHVQLDHDLPGEVVLPWSYVQVRRVAERLNGR